jgi:2-polyprenyl-6-methoxyphenol hydroxylase-like FAD-dependent oxidoreductase
VVTDGALLVCDAAEFFDPFTGEGIGTALQGAEFAADATVAALADGGQATAVRLAPYRLARRTAFAGRRAVERLVGYGMCFPRCSPGRQAAGTARTLGLFIGVTGDYLPARG